MSHSNALPPIDKGGNMNIETKQLGGNVLETKEVDRNGVKVGIVKGYIATWDLDRGSYGVKDRFMPGAFAKSILDHQSSNRQVRFKDHHGRTVGGFPASTVHEDATGLFGEGEINLEVQQGREAFLLAKQGVLTDFSVGFSSLADTESTVNGETVRSISEATLWEGSIVDEPMNPAAKITEVKELKADDVKEWTERDVEKFLKSTGMLSRSAAKALASNFTQKKKNTDNTDELNKLMSEIKLLTKKLSK